MISPAWPLWWRLGLAAGSGLLLNLAFPPADLRWIAFIALVPLLLALRGARGRQAALVGLVFGAAFFGVLIYWISYAGYAAYIALVIAMAVYQALFGLLAARTIRGGMLGRLLGVPLLWAGVEMTRARVPAGGFTWGSLGYSQHSGGSVLSIARVGGVYVLGLVLVMCNALLVELFFTAEVRTRRALIVGLAALFLVPSVLPLGLAGARAGTFDVAAIQGNVPRERFSGLGRRGRVGPEDLVIIDNHIRETEKLVGAPPDLIVWPENAFDRDPRFNVDLLERATATTSRVDAPLLAGAILDAGDRFTNSNLLILQDGTIEQRYDKIHLVPFGEYVPWSVFRRIVPALDRELPTDGVAGTRPAVFDVDGVKVGSVICFESSYPSLVRDQVRNGAQVIVVTTNNATFGTSPLAREHVAMSRMRAVEQGRAVVHAAIAGISAIILPDGAIVDETGLFTAGTVRARVPLTDAQTPYGRFGAAIELLAGLGALWFAIAPRARPAP